MNESDDMIQAYIQKVLRIQQEQKQRPLDEYEMQRIAEELGMSSDDFAFIQKKFKDYLARGQGYSRYEDWDSAIEEFEQAIVLNPSNVDVLYGLANAHKQRWMTRKDKEDFNKAKNYAKRALHIDPDHDASYKLTSELNKGIMNKTNPFAKETKPTFENFGDFDINKFMSKLDNKWDADIIKFNTDKKLKRSIRDKKIFGVCGGIGEYFGIDPTWVRIAFILGMFLTGGFTAFVYIVMAFILPKN
jgi:phage shock protein PspC (stress-responsive transcriptional regulator)